MDNFLKEWKSNHEYFFALKVLASLSRLFSENSIPYLDYRLTENVFCEYFKAKNEARACNAYDARMNDFGIGIKTFTLKNNHSLEKIAEFDRLKPQLDSLNGIELARQLGVFRNERIRMTDRLYNTNRKIYHIVGRCEGLLRIFNTKYEEIDIDHIQISKCNQTSLHFNDGKNEYSFMRSKSVLQKHFYVSDNDICDIPVSIIENPLKFLLNFFKNDNSTNYPLSASLGKTEKLLRKGKDYVILPLYGKSGTERRVPEKSGLNQWNAKGRVRNPNEVYIPIPKEIHNKYPEFFPNRDEYFLLKLPEGNFLQVKVCQDNSKALMSTHNADLGNWILRKILNKKEGELVTIYDLDRFGIDSVQIVNLHKKNSSGQKIYSISFTSDSYESYSDFISSDD